MEAGDTIMLKNVEMVIQKKDESKYNISSILESATTSGAVSYTHLDVYKRQI